MNTKSSWITLALVLLAIMFVPLAPNDVLLECRSDLGEECQEVSANISVYQKYFK